MSGTSTPTSGYFTKLPPIITNECDREFVTTLTNYIEHEMTVVNPELDDDEQRYIIYKTAFNKVVEHVTAYQPLLTTIKKEYEDTIEAIKKAQREAAFLHAKLKAMASEPSTIRNYRKRSDELEERIGIVRKDNERLEKQVEEMKMQRSEREKIEREITEPPKRELKTDQRLIPGLSLDESVNQELLLKKLDRLDRQYKELNITFKTRYVPKARKIELKDNLDSKVAYRDLLLRQGHFFKAKRQRLKVALEAAQAYNRVKPPHQTVGDAVTTSLSHAAGYLKSQQEKGDGRGNEDRYSRSRAEEGVQNEGDAKREGSPGAPSTSSAFEEDDPNKEKEAEMMLEYIEKFNELFEDGKYEEAAIHAANSPKGILRTSATLSKFRDVKKRSVNGRSPLLSFCDALMSSAETGSTKPNEVLSLECVACALSENRLDLLSHWITKDRLSLSAEVGELICDHCRTRLSSRNVCLSLAQHIFMSLKLYKEVVICLLHQGRVETGLEFAQKKVSLSRDDCINVLRSCPSVQLATALVDRGSESSFLLPVGLIIKSLLQVNKYDLVLQLLQELQTEPLQGDVACSVFQSAVLGDNETSMEDWEALVSLLQGQGYEETAMNLLASTTVLATMKNALKRSEEVNDMEEANDK